MSLRELKRRARERMQADAGTRLLLSRARWLKADNDRKMRELLAGRHEE
jgi:hypothetical protein